MSNVSQTNSVRSTALRLWALLLGIGFLLAGNGLQGSLLGLVAEDTGFSSSLTGIVMTAYFAGFLMGSSLSERFISRVGHVRTFAALASLSSVAVLVHGLYVEPITWAVMRFITGMSFAGLYVVTESWLNQETTSEHRGSLLAVYVIVSHIGFAIGQVMLNIAPSETLTLYIVASMILSFSVLPILLSSAPQPHINLETERLSFSALWRTTPLGTTGAFLTGVINGILFGMAVVYARQIGLGIGSISYFIAAIVIGGAIFQWPVGKLSDKFDRRKVIIGVALIAALISASLQIVTNNQWTLMFMSFGLGGMVLCLHPLFLSYANDRFDSDQMVSAASSLVMLHGAGAMLGPIGAGLTMGLVGPSGFVIYLTACLLLLAIFTAYRTIIADLPEEKEDFLYAPATTGVNDVWAEIAADNSEEHD